MTAIANHPHRVSTAITGVRAELSSVAEVPVWSLDPAETTTALAEVQSAKAQLAELEARLLCHADRLEVGGITGVASTATWYAVATNTVRPAAHRLMRTAHSLDVHDQTRTALATGVINAEQAEVILRALDDLPDDLDPDPDTDLDTDVLQRAEAHLLELAADHDAKALRVLGRRILEVVSPETADAHEASLLAREERAAQEVTRLTMWDDGHGRVHGRFTVDALTGAALKKALMAIAAPKHQASNGSLGHQGEPGGRRPTPERWGQAFTEYIQRYPAKKLPKAGGLSATVVVTMTLDTLMGGLKAAHLDTGEMLSPGAARRLACESRIIPVVLGGNSQVLDIGRGSRFHTEAQRIAKAIEARGCQIEGCDEPPGRTHMHHPIRWVDGGGTNRDGIMICPWHHNRAHDQRYQMKKLPTGKYTFNRRT